MSNTLQPLSQSGRDRNLDILRGFALAGVLFMFCVSDNGPSYGYTGSLLDEIISWPKYILIESRMYTMLIIIFGIGFHVQLEKAKRSDTSLVPAFTRRIIGLLIIGFIHAIVLSTRDILMFYGIAGAVLLLARNATNKQLILFMVALFYIVAPIIQYNLNNPWPQAAALVEPNNYPDYVQYNWQFFKFYHQIYNIYIEMLFYFLFGFLISRSGIFQKIKANKKFRRRMLILSLAAAVVFIPFWYFWEPEVLPGLVGGITNRWIKILIGFGFRTLWQTWMVASVILYATILIGLASSYKRRNFFKPLAAFGQMALSNYLIQSLILVPYLLLMNKMKNLPPFEGFILFVVFIALQLLFSNWWMSRYKLGPFEWLLRSFTYWKWQSIKKPLQSQFDNEKQTITISAPQYL